MTKPTPIPCDCPDTGLIVHGYMGTILDDIRQGFVHATCQMCGRAWEVAISDCLTPVK